jgi:hypothetical protein
MRANRVPYPSAREYGGLLLPDPPVSHHGIRERLGRDRCPGPVASGRESADGEREIVAVELDDEIEIGRSAKVAVQHDRDTPHYQVSDLGPVQRLQHIFDFADQSCIIPIGK